MQGHASFAPGFLIFYSACHICLQFVLFCHFLCAFYPVPNTLGIYLQFRKCIAGEVGQFLMGTPKGKEETSSEHSRGERSETTGWVESKYSPLLFSCSKGKTFDAYKKFNPRMTKKGQICTGEEEGL